MKAVPHINFRSLATIGGLVAAVYAANVMLPDHLVPGQLSFISTAQAAEKGGAGEKGHGKKGQTDASAAAGGSASGKSGKPTGAGGGQVSGSKLGRLSMARAFVSPGFDITKVDDPLAPIAQISLYRDTVTDAYSDEALTVAGTALGNAATVNPVTVDTVTKLNSILKLQTTWTTSQLEALATKATEVLVSRRTEETETQ
jgi:hypothetical protein